MVTSRECCLKRKSWKWMKGLRKWRGVVRVRLKGLRKRSGVVRVRLRLAEEERCRAREEEAMRDDERRQRAIDKNKRQRQGLVAAIASRALGAEQTVHGTGSAQEVVEGRSTPDVHTGATWVAPTGGASMESEHMGNAMAGVYLSGQLYRTSAAEAEEQHLLGAPCFFEQEVDGMSAQDVHTGSAQEAPTEATGDASQQMDRAMENAYLSGQTYRTSDADAEEQNLQGAHEQEVGENEEARERRMRKEAQWRSMFNITVKPNRERKYEFERLNEAAVLVAETCLRVRVTLPAHPQNTSEPWAEVSSGGRLPPVSCAFRNCIWHCGHVHVTPEAIRKHQEHPWEYLLREHVLAEHGERLHELAAPLLDRKRVEKQLP